MISIINHTQFHIFNDF